MESTGTQLNLRQNADPVNLRDISGKFIILLLAKLVFLAAGYMIYFLLPRLLNSPAEFGRYGILNGILNVVNMMLIIGIMQSVSKFVSERPQNERQVRIAAVKLQTWIAIPVFFLFSIGAPFLSRFFHDPLLRHPAMIAGVIPALYAYYGIFTGSLNGQKRYCTQAVLDMFYAVLKASLILGTAYIAGSFAGAIGGFCISAVIIVPVAAYILHQTSIPGEQSRFSTYIILRFSFLVMLISGIQNLTIHADLFSLRVLIDSSESSSLAGFYTAAQTFSRLPFTLVSAAALLFYPIISRTAYIQDTIQTKVNIHQAGRLTLMLSIPLAGFIAIHATNLLTVVYPAGYEIAASSLRILIVAGFFLAVLHVFGTMITGLGKPLITLISLCGSLSVQLVACNLLIPRFGMDGAALGSLSGWITGCLLTGIYLAGFHGNPVPLINFIRILGASVFAGLTGYLIPDGNWIILTAQAAVFFMVYATGLIVFREIPMESITAPIKKYFFGK